MLTSYPVIVNHLLKRYAIDDIISEAEGALRRFSKQPHQYASY